MSPHLGRAFRATEPRLGKAPGIWGTSQVDGPSVRKCEETGCRQISGLICGLGGEGRGGRGRWGWGSDDPGPSNARGRGIRAPPPPPAPVRGTNARPLRCTPLPLPHHGTRGYSRDAVRRSGLTPLMSRAASSNGFRENRISTFQNAICASLRTALNIRAQQYQLEKASENHPPSLPVPLRPPNWEVPLQRFHGTIRDLRSLSDLKKGALRCRTQGIEE